MSNTLLAMLQVSNYQTAATTTAMPASDPGPSSSSVTNIKTSLFALFELDNSLTYTSGFNIAKRLADVTAIHNALSDLSQLNTDSQPSPPGALVTLQNNLNS